LRFLYEGVQKHHPSFVNTEQNASNAIASQVAANFPQSPAHRSAQGYADRPGELDVLDVLADDLSVFGAKRRWLPLNWPSAMCQTICKSITRK
jgi:hypothetical protein